jgi:DegV family protein with EDD domain
MTRIIVDSTCDLPDNLLKRYSIITLPMLMSLDGTEYQDKVTITPSAVYDAMKSGVVPKTSQVDYGALTDVFDELTARGEGFIYLAFSSGLSGTYGASKVICDEYIERFPELDMAVMDSRGGCMATGLIALQAAEQLENGVAFKDVLAHIIEMTVRVEHVFTIADLRWLVKGGRLDPLSGMIGSLLNVKPILDVRGGKIEIIKKTRGFPAAIEAVAAIAADRARSFPEQLIGIAHAGNLPGVELLKNAVMATLGATNFVVSEIGSVLAAHLGVGSLGLFFFNSKPKGYRQLTVKT